MLIFTRNLGPRADLKSTLTLELSAHERQLHRLKLTLEDGTGAGIILPREERAPQAGDLLSSEDGTLARVAAKIEEVMMVRIADPLRLAKICYHLGNRHLPLEIVSDALFYEEDPVISRLLAGIGFTPEKVQRAFNPENGAYHQHSHGHHHDHDGSAGLLEHEHAPDHGHHAASQGHEAHGDMALKGALLSPAVCSILGTGCCL